MEAIQAAGNWQLDAAWSHILALVRDPATPKSLLLPAIGAVASIRPAEAQSVVGLADSDDEEIAEAVDEAIAMAKAVSDEEGDEEVGSEWTN